MLHVCPKMQARVPCMYAVVRVRKCASGEGLNSPRMCVHKCERARPALMRSYGLTFASGEGLNSLCMSCHKCPCVRSACVRLCPSCARVARGSTRAECVLRDETGRTVHQCGRARAHEREWRGAQLVLHVCSGMDACAPCMNAVARAQVVEWRGAQLAKHVRLEMQARENVLARELHILLVPLFALNPSIERCNYCELQNALR